MNQEEIEAKYLIEINASLTEAAKQAMRQVVEQLSGEGKSEAEITRTICSAFESQAMLTTYPALAACISEQYKDAYNQVVKQLDNVKLNWDIKDSEAIAAINKHVAPSLSKHYASMPDKVQEAVNEALNSGLPVAEIARQLRQSVGGLVETTQAYNEMLVATNSSLARVTSQVTAMEKAGVKYSKVFGYKDERTCSICSKLIGRVISVEKLQSWRDDYLSSQNLDEVKTANKWYLPKQVTNWGLASGDLATNIKETAKLGVSAPPYHGRCRCQLVAEFGEVEEKQVLENGVSGGKLERVPPKTINGKIRATRTIKELADLVKKETGLDCNFDGFNVKMARLQTLKLTQLAAEYSTNNLLFVTGDSSRRNFGSYNYGEKKIRISSELCGDIETYKATRKKEIKAGSKSEVSPNNILFSTLVHEFGHSLIISPIASRIYANEVWNPISEIRKAYIAEIDKHLKKYWKTQKELTAGIRYTSRRGRELNGAYDYLRGEMGKDYISKYAEDGYGRNPWDEFLAESFTKAKLGTPGKFDSRVIEIIDTLFKKK